MCAVDIKTMMYMMLLFSYEEAKKKTLHESGTLPVLTGAKLGFRSGDKLCKGSYIKVNKVMRER